MLDLRLWRASSFCWWRSAACNDGRRPHRGYAAPSHPFPLHWTCSKTRQLACHVLYISTAEIEHLPETGSRMQSPQYMWEDPRQYRSSYGAISLKLEPSSHSADASWRMQVGSRLSKLLCWRQVRQAVQIPMHLMIEQACVDKSGYSGRLARFSKYSISSVIRGSVSVLDSSGLIQWPAFEVRTQVRSLGSGRPSLLPFHMTFLYNKTNIQHVFPSNILAHLLTFMLCRHCGQSMIGHHAHSSPATDTMTVHTRVCIICPQLPQRGIKWALFLLAGHQLGKVAGAQAQAWACHTSTVECKSCQLDTSRMPLVRTDRTDAILINHDVLIARLSLTMIWMTLLEGLASLAIIDACMTSHLERSLHLTGVTERLYVNRRSQSGQSLRSSLWLLINSTKAGHDWHDLCYLLCS